jgi:hypothetical protein
MLSSVSVFFAPFTVNVRGFELAAIAGKVTFHEHEFR